MGPGWDDSLWAEGGKADCSVPRPAQQFLPEPEPKPEPEPARTASETAENGGALKMALILGVSTVELELQGTMQVPFRALAGGELHGP